MRLTILVVGSVFCCASCDREQQHKKTEQYTWHGDTLCISDDAQLLRKLKIGTVHSEPFRMQTLTAGTVKAIPTQYAEIAPPFSGRVTRSYLSLGMKTNPETPLFEISSPDFISAQKIFFQERSQLEQAGKNLRRQQDLVANGVGTQKDLDEAQTAYEVEKSEYKNALIGITIFKANPDKLSLGQPYVVRATISGEVVNNKVVLGQFIKDDAASIATVAELSKIWIAAQVKEKDIRFVHQSDECGIAVAALPDKPIKGTVYHVSEIVDETTRSVEVFIEADNKDHALKPGMYVTVNFMHAPIPAILVPAKAILQMNESSFVFVETAQGRYVQRRVGISGTAQDRVVVSSGLRPGERIITEGGFYLLDAQ